MKIRPPRALLLLALLAVPAWAGDLAIKDAVRAPEDFPVVVQGRTADILVDKSEAEVVHIAASLLASDIARVSGAKPTVADSARDRTAPAIVLGTLDSPLITDLVRRHKLDVSALAGRWEAFRIATVAAPFPGVPSALVIAGSDRRGAAYGAVTLSAALGVSPWEWWADVPVPHRDTLVVSPASGVADQPAVKYRGIFLNDEDWGLQPWAAKTFEPEVGNLGPKTYAKICELLLRLKANTLWPAMHECTKAFHLVPGNAAVADRYAIVLGSSHAEPMLRNNVGEWTADKKLYNYVANPDGVHAYWEQRVKERVSGDSLFTLGMRGIHDSPIIGPKTQAERIATLEKIFADQRGLLARYLGQGDPTRVGQIFCPYKEVLDDYNAGLKVPDDVTLVWPDDNFGYIRRFATPAEKARSGGGGVYYHASYLGAPLAWLWLDSLPPALVWTEMTKAYEQGDRSVWIVNVGDLKNTERSTEFFLDLAWRADRTDPGAPARWVRATAARDFGEQNADAIASILARHHLLASARKPEHLQWNLPGQAYQPTELTEREILARLDAYAALVRDTDAVAASLPASAQDAFFELVAYPVEAAAAANEHYFRHELARILQGRGDTVAATAALAACERGASRVAELTARYNERIAGGKWSHIVAINGLSAREWKKFQPDTLPPLASGLPASPAPEAPSPASPATPPADARPGDFFESAGVVAIDAGHFSARSDLASGAGWRSVPGLGRTGSAVTVLPTTAALTPTSAPRLDYRVHIATRGPASVRIRLLPTYPLVPDKGLRLALALDDGPALPLAVTTGFDNKSDAWKHRVLANATEAVLTLPAPLAPGWHTLHLVAVDPGVVVDKIVLDLGGLRPSYDGPDETRVP